MLGQSKVSYTHIIAYAIVKALEDFPNLNNAFADNGGESFRLVRNQIAHRGQGDTIGPPDRPTVMTGYPTAADHGDEHVAHTRFEPAPGLAAEMTREMRSMRGAKRAGVVAEKTIK